VDGANAGFAAGGSVSEEAAMSFDCRSPLSRRLEDRSPSRIDRGERLLWHWHCLRREEALIRARALYTCEPCTVEEFRARERLDELAGVPHGLNYDDADLADWAWSRVCEENGFRWKRAFRVTEEQRGEIGL
jgi:hypothetical protein